MRITENEIDLWVSAHSSIAQGKVVELVARLVAASCPNPQERRFPLSDSTNQRGPDGYLKVAVGKPPNVPEGVSFWEIGTGRNAAEKATTDYRKLTRAIPSEDRAAATFVFVTPLSGVRDWDFSWRPKAQGDWIRRRRKLQEWKDVRVVDGTKLAAWVNEYPAVALWMAELMGGGRWDGVDGLEQHWLNTASIGAPPSLGADLFLANRDEAIARMRGLVSGASARISLETHFPDQVADFVGAFVAQMDETERVEVFGRSLVVSTEDAWKRVSAAYSNLILVAGSSLDLSGASGTRLLQSASRFGHQVIFTGSPAGIPDPSGVPLRSPFPHQVEQALTRIGYGEERARTLASRSNGNISSLLRCIQNLSALPEWADGSAAGDLALAAALGAWREDSDADRSIVERVSGKAYGEWIRTIRRVHGRRGTPLAFSNGRWTFLSRYEGWYLLGPLLGDAEIESISSAAVEVLSELDPALELDKNKRYAATLFGKQRAHSGDLRVGLAGFLALLGSHSAALHGAGVGVPTRLASGAVRKLLSQADSILLASLDDVLPLVAEADPSAFLDGVDEVLANSPSPVEAVFAQEGEALFGKNYMVGLLWALETLAWDADQLARSVHALGGLASKDPGGSWGNRPQESLIAVLLPWFPQTCATVGRRIAAVRGLVRSQPNVAWSVLLKLLPAAQAATSYTRRPAWRQSIPEDWRPGSTRGDYIEQIQAYSKILVDLARHDRSRLVELVEHVASLPPDALAAVLRHIESDVVGLSEQEREPLWTALIDIVTKHRRFSDANWAMSPEQLAQIVAVANALEPGSLHYQLQRLFTERDTDLFEKQGQYEDQRRSLDAQRETGVGRLFANGGTSSVMAFAEAVEAPWRVGVAFAAIASATEDAELLPGLLSASGKIGQFLGGYVWGRFYGAGWEWVDSRLREGWSEKEVGLFLSLLPFLEGAWSRANAASAEAASIYWGSVRVEPYRAEAPLQGAIDELLDRGRPAEAIQCLVAELHQKRQLDHEQVSRALRDVAGPNYKGRSIGEYEVTELIAALQKDPKADEEMLLEIEWIYMPLLGFDPDAAPKTLERRLARDPAFFCEVLGKVFGAKPDMPTPSDKAAAENAFRLLQRWSVPPGASDGDFDPSRFESWLSTALDCATKADHRALAMNYIGQVLFHAPPDPDGLWIHKDVAKVLDGPDASDMRGGFFSQVITARGVHSVDPSAKPELELAKQFRLKADDIDDRGFPRFARTLRDVASGYEAEAQSILNRHLPLG